MLTKADEKYYHTDQEAEQEKLARARVAQGGVIEGVSAYHMHAAPLDTISEWRSVRMSRVQEDLRCAICMETIREARATMECLHRFCKGCILQSLRVCKKECPSCRMPCATKRNLRADAAFDLLVHVLYPDRQALQAQQEAIDVAYTAHRKSLPQKPQKRRKVSPSQAPKKEASCPATRQQAPATSKPRKVPETAKSRKAPQPQKKAPSSKKRHQEPAPAPRIDTRTAPRIERLYVRLLRMPGEQHLAELLLPVLKSPRLAPVSALLSLVSSCCKVAPEDVILRLLVDGRREPINAQLTLGQVYARTQGAQTEGKITIFYGRKK